MWLQLIVVLAAIIIGARLGGIGLGVMGGLGLALLCFVFGLQPTAPPIVRASAHRPAHRRDADDCGRHFGSLVYAGCRRT